MCDGGRCVNCDCPKTFDIIIDFKTNDRKTVDIGTFLTYDDQIIVENLRSFDTKNQTLVFSNLSILDLKRSIRILKESFDFVSIFVISIMLVTYYRKSKIFKTIYKALERDEKIQVLLFSLHVGNTCSFIYYTKYIKLNKDDLDLIRSYLDECKIKPNISKISKEFLDFYTTNGLCSIKNPFDVLV